MEAYCVKCRTKREISNPVAEFTSAGQPATRGVCPVCSTTLYRMGRTDAHEGLQPPEKVRGNRDRRSGKLVIVESPAKAKTIYKILGKEFSVKASIGHVKDLPEKDIGVDVDDNFKPQYVVIPGKEKIIKELKKASKELFLYPPEVLFTVIRPICPLMKITLPIR